MACKLQSSVATEYKTETDVESCDSDEDEEPKLKYERISGDLQEIFKMDGASSIFVNSKLLILGTNWGRIHVLDHQGNVIRQFHKHSGPIIMIDMDATGDFIASCSHDKRVVIQGLYEIEHSHSMILEAPVRCIAIDPYYNKPRSGKRFLIGTHQVILYEKALFGALRSSVLSEPSRNIGDLIRNIKWKGQFMAWAAPSAVRVMDMDSKKIISLVKRDHSLALGCDQYPPHICWQDDYTFLIGWGDSVKVCRVRERTINDEDSTTQNLLELPPYRVEILYMFTTDFYICGIGPLDKLVVVLAYSKNFSHSGEKNNTHSNAVDSQEKEKSDVTSSLEWRRPQMRVLLPLQGTYEELSKDVLAIRCYQDYRPVNYHLEHLSEERRFYIVCPQDVVVAKPREPHDRVQWLLEHNRYQEALEVVEACGGVIGQYTALTIGQSFIDRLLDAGKFKEAAEICPRVLGIDRLLWEKMVVRFNELHQLKALSCHIPIGPPGPLLNTSVYQSILVDLLKDDHETFLEVIQQWPKTIYNISFFITSVLEVLTENSNNTVLLRALAHLYSNVDKHDKALAIYLKLQHKDVFLLIRRHSLYNCVAKHIAQLMTLDAETALNICSDHIESLKPEIISTFLSKHDHLLFKYLDMLYENHKDQSAKYHNQLLKLYAIYAKEKIMPLLLSSSTYDLIPALEIVRSYHLMPETVYMLVRMGNPEEALRIVLMEEEDINWAMKICKEHSDPDLWMLLIRHSLNKPLYIRELLNNIGAHVDPLLILQCIPRNLEIPGLRDALTKILHDYQLKISLQDGYQKILMDDVAKLLGKQVSVQSSGMPVRSYSECSGCNQKIRQLKTDDEGETVVFWCRHIYHRTCLESEEFLEEVCAVCRMDRKLIPSS